MRVFYQMIGQLKEEMTEKKENVNHHLILIIFVIKSSFSNFHVIIFIVIRRGILIFFKILNMFTL